MSMQEAVAYLDLAYGDADKDVNDTPTQTRDATQKDIDALLG